LRIYNLVKRIAVEHEVWLASFVEDHQLEGLHCLESICSGVVTAPAENLGALARPIDWIRCLAAGTPPDLRLYQSPELRRKITRLLSEREFDVIDVLDSHMAPYMESISDRNRFGTILTFIDILASQYDRTRRLEPKWTRKLRLTVHSLMMRRWEPRYAGRFDRCIAVSEVERRYLLEKNPGLEVDVVPNGVDTELLRPLPEVDSPPAAVFVGNMDYRPNVDAAAFFCRDILPRLRRRVPELEFWIVGLNPRAEVKRLEGNGVHVTGRVEDVCPFYQRSTVSVVPLRAGSGTRLKILEAMALGRPVVSTSIGCEGLDVSDGQHLLVADTPEEFAEKTRRLLTEPALRRTIKEKARELVTERFDWNAIARDLMDVYARVAAREVRGR
jgi:sugar transferase (PEP-CTERM/EpsH1 system associated)